MGWIWIVITLLSAIAGIPVVRQLRDHPHGLWLLFFVEMWERFSYYGMRSLLIFYLSEHFLFTDGAAQRHYSAYVALINLLPLAGGLLGDRIIGARRAVAFGALLLVAGHCAMAIESFPAQESVIYVGRVYPVKVHGRGTERTEALIVDGKPVIFRRDKTGTLNLDASNRSTLPAQILSSKYQKRIDPITPLSQGIFNLALALIIVGVGFQKANMTALVGALYAGRTDRDQGFTLYMFGINIGAFFSTILCGWLGTQIGWWAGFGAAGIGMAAGYIALLRYGKVLGSAGSPPPIRRARTIHMMAYVSAIPTIAAVWWLVQQFAMTGILLGISSLTLLAYLGWIARYRCSSAERRNMSIAMTLILLCFIWTVFAEQQGAALSLFIERNTSLRLFNIAIDAAQSQAFYMGFVLILVPVLAGLWGYLAKRNRDFTPVSKFALAFFLQALSFILLSSGGVFAHIGGRVPFAFVVGALLVHAASEMTLGPIGLAEVTRRAPRTLPSTLVATWFVAVSWGQWLGGLLSLNVAAADGLPSNDWIGIYSRLFAITAGGATVATVATIAFALWLSRNKAVISRGLDTPERA